MTHPMTSSSSEGIENALGIAESAARERVGGDETWSLFHAELSALSRVAKPSQQRGRHA
jgi:hypothetical protein